MSRQKYFHTKEWQKKEAEADEDIRRGDVYGPFETMEEFKNALKKSEESLNETRRKMGGADEKEIDRAIQEAISSIRNSKPKTTSPTKE